MLFASLSHAKACLKAFVNTRELSLSRTPRRAEIGGLVRVFSSSTGGVEVPPPVIVILPVPVITSLLIVLKVVTGCLPSSSACRPVTLPIVWVWLVEALPSERFEVLLLH